MAVEHETKAPASTGAGSFIMNRRKKSKRKSTQYATPAPADPQPAGDPVEESLERGRNALEASRRARELSPEDIARKARNDAFEKKLHEAAMGAMDRLAGRETGSVLTPPTTVKLTLEKREKSIWDVLQRGSRGLEYCRELDHAGIGPLRSGVWKDCPRKYESAYKQGKPWPQRIQNEKSKVRRKAELAELASE